MPARRLVQLLLDDRQSLDQVSKAVASTTLCLDGPLGLVLAAQLDPEHRGAVAQQEHGAVLVRLEITQQ